MADKLIPERIVTSGARRAPARTLLAIDIVTQVTSTSIFDASVMNENILLVMTQPEKYSICVKREGCLSFTSICLTTLVTVNGHLIHVK